MCDSRIGKFFASIGGYFSAPTFGKATPAYAASAAPALGIDLPDVVAVVTLIYTVVLLIAVLGVTTSTIDSVAVACHRMINSRSEALSAL